MSKDNSSQLLVSSLLNINIKSQKEIVISFLKEVYKNCSKRSKHLFNTYTLQEILRLPMIISNKIYFLLNGESDQMLTQNQFANGIFKLLFSTNEEKMEMTFFMYDFDNDDVINKEDVFLILSHFHLIENTTDTIDTLEAIINHFFENETRMKKKKYIEKCRYQNCDVCLLFIIFLNQYLLFFNDEELEYFESAIMNNPLTSRTESSNEQKGSPIKSSVPDYFKPSSSFIDYLMGLTIKNEKIFYALSKVQSGASTTEDDELEEIENFENDIHEVFQNLIFMENYDKLKKNKTFNMPFEKKFAVKKSKNSQFKTSDGSSYDSIVPTPPQKFNFNSKQFTTASTLLFSHAPVKACTDFEGNNVMKAKEQNEIFLYKSPNKSYNSLVKLVVVGQTIFYFRGTNNKNFNFKKLIPLCSLFPRKSSDNEKLYLTSVLHKYYKQYSFYGDSKEIEDYVSLLNKITNYSKVTDDYELKEEIGRGKFGKVVKALDKSSGKIYAVKIISKNNPSEEDYKINRWETTLFNIIQNINHPNIIKCFKMYETDKSIYYVYEYIEGSDLKQYIDDKSPSTNDLKTNLELSIQIIRGVACLHKYGIIHRDIKPSNILLDSEAKKDEEKVKIIDFGLSRVLGKDEYSTDQYGSLCFKAPELIKHLPYDFRVDVWALGISIFYLVFKQLPFNKIQNDELKQSILKDNVNFPVINMGKFNVSNCQNIDDIISFIYALIGDCLEKKMEDRPDINKIVNKYVEKYQDELEDL